jgi:hypothetical protein
MGKRFEGQFQVDLAPQSLAPDAPDKIVFVGGAPRAGTTVTHALLCTAPGFAPYHPELSFFRTIPSAYRLGRSVWNEHTGAFFADQAAFAELMRQTARSWLDHTWRALGRPTVLSVKDPHLTPMFPDVQRLLPQEAWFVTVCRHPCDVVRSRQQVHEKSGVGPPFGEAQVAAVAREYLTYYQAVLTTNFGGRHFMFRYEDLGADRVRDGLAQFLGVGDFALANLWRTADGGEIAPGHEGPNPWGSPKYFRDIDLTRRLEPLRPDWQPLVKSICRPVMTRMGYD